MFARWLSAMPCLVVVEPPNVPPQISEALPPLDGSLAPPGGYPARPQVPKRDAQGDY